MTHAAKRLNATAARQRAIHNAVRLGFHKADVIGKDLYRDDYKERRSIIVMDSASFASPRQDGLMFNIYDFGQMQ